MLRVSRPHTRPPRGRVERYCTCSRVNVSFDQVLVLVNPLAVAFEVDLSGRCGAAGEGHRLVLDDINIIGLHQEVGQKVGEGHGKRMRYRGRVLCTCDGKCETRLVTGFSCSDA